MDYEQGALNVTAVEAPLSHPRRKRRIALLTILAAYGVQLIDVSLSRSSPT
jgi:hypothetical protein